jgi:hypothetical protein
VRGSGGSGGGVGEGGSRRGHERRSNALAWERPGFTLSSFLIQFKQGSVKRNMMVVRRPCWQGWGVPQIWDEGGAQWVGGKYRRPQASGVKDPNGIGDPDRGAEGDCVGGGFQAKLEG